MPPMHASTINLESDAMSSEVGGQVLDIQQKGQRPDVVLKALYETLDRAVKNGDGVAQQIKE